MGLLNGLGGILWSTVNAAIRFSRWSGLFKTRVCCLGSSYCISVGNIQVGGNGKTPLVAWIAEFLLNQGKSVAILTRGYQSKSECVGRVVQPFEKPAADWASLIGDEPTLLHEMVPAAWMGVGKNRAEQFGKITRKLGKDPDVVILDDGLQQFWIRRQVDLIVLGGRSRFQTLYRDFIFVVQKWQEKSHASKQVWISVGAKRRCDAELRIQSKVILGKLPLARVLFHAALGDPHRVLNAVKAMGIDVVETHFIGDHEAIPGTVAKGLIEKCGQRGWVLAMTGKDYVKWRELPVGIDAQIDLGKVIVLDSELHWVHGQQKVESCLFG